MVRRIRACPQGEGRRVPVAAAIAAVHDEAATAQDTDWPQILAIYGLLEQMTGNPMVTRSRAVAMAMVGPAAGLLMLETLDEPLAGHHRLDAVLAHLLEMAGDHEAAISHYRGRAHNERGGARLPDDASRPAWRPSP